LDGLQISHVCTCAESATCASQHDHANCVVVRSTAHGRSHVVMHPLCPGVQPVGPIERDCRNTFFYIVENVLSLHVRVFSLYLSGSQCRPGNRRELIDPWKTL